MRDKILALDEFNEKYRELNETNKKTFSRIVNKLIKETFIVKEKELDKGIERGEEKGVTLQFSVRIDILNTRQKKLLNDFLNSL